MTAAMSSLIFKRAAASRTSGEWREDDYDVVADGIVWPHHEARRCSGGNAVAMDAGLRAPRGTKADPRLRGHARGRNGGIREKLATGVVLRLGGPLSGANRKNKRPL